MDKQVFSKDTDSPNTQVPQTAWLVFIHS